MQVEHKQIIYSGNTVIYINVYIEDKYEFGKENFGKAEAGKNIKNRILDYVKAHVNLIQGAIIVIAINGMVVGALSLDGQETIEKPYGGTYGSQEVEEVIEIMDNKNNESDESSTGNVDKTEEGERERPTITNNANVDKKDNSDNTNNVEKPTSSMASIPKLDTNVTQSEIHKKEENTKKENISSKYYIKLNSGGIVQTMELEEYIVGVVAAEMPASFNTEALKAQAIAARTYAVKKTSQGKTLINSTADQVYKTTAQMKSTWGSQYGYYYNRVKNAVNATQGLVLKYNGEYIDAQYSAMTNGKTELPEYVWSFSRPYLQCVSSTWDEQVKNFKVTKSFSYDTVSKALGQNISKDTSIEVLKRTVSDRVEKIKIGEKTYTGVEVRTSLGLRSTDFTIELGDTVNITTKGYGHGVGMSQYGANVAANQGYTYSQILSHYYVGAVISSI